VGRVLAVSLSIVVTLQGILVQVHSDAPSTKANDAISILATFDEFLKTDVGRRLVLVTGYFKYDRPVDLDSETVKCLFSKPKPSSTLELLSRVAEEHRPTLARLKAALMVSTIIEAKERDRLEQASSAFSGSILCTAALLASAHVQLAQGSYDGAFDDLATALAVLDASAQYLPWIAWGLWEFSDPIFSFVQRHASQLCIPHWERLEDWARKALAQPVPFSDMLKEYEARITCQPYPRDDVTDDLDKSVVYYDGETETWRVPGVVRHLLASERIRIFQSATEMARAHNERWHTIFYLPESEWQCAAKRLLAEMKDCDLIGPEPGNVEDLMKVAARSLMEDRELLLGYVADFRTALRLFVLHARINTYRHQHDRLPIDLAQVAKPSDLLNPLSGTPFRYERLGASGYRVFADPFLDRHGGPLEQEVRLFP